MSTLFARRRPFRNHNGHLATQCGRLNLPTTPNRRHPRLLQPLYGYQKTSGETYVYRARTLQYGISTQTPADRSSLLLSAPPCGLMRPLTVCGCVRCFLPRPDLSHVEALTAAWQDGIRLHASGRGVFQTLASNLTCIFAKDSRVWLLGMILRAGQYHITLLFLPFSLLWTSESWHRRSDRGGI